MRISELNDYLCVGKNITIVSKESVNYIRGEISDRN